MKAQYLDYSIIIEKGKQTGTNNFLYVAHCPSLGIADDGKTIEEAMDNIKSLIEFHLKCIAKEGDVLESNSSAVFTQVHVKRPNNLKLVN